MIRYIVPLGPGAKKVVWAAGAAAGIIGVNGDWVPVEEAPPGEMAGILGAMGW